jgi:hypothetical protein
MMMSDSVYGFLDYKRLEHIQGFLRHLSMTYLIVTPYLKGLHLTLALHHTGRNKFGWKMASKERVAYLFESAENGKMITHDKAESMSRAAVEPVSSEPEDGSLSPHQELLIKRPFHLPLGGSREQED